MIRSEADLVAYYAAHPERRPPRGSEPQALPPTTPEATLLHQIRQLTTPHGWLCYHTWRSDKSEPGFPDLVLVKPGRLIFAEVKSRTGKLTPPQATWLALLARSVPGVETYTWRPQDWPAIVHILTGDRP